MSRIPSENSRAIEEMAPVLVLGSACGKMSRPEASCSSEVLHNNRAQCFISLCREVQGEEWRLTPDAVFNLFQPGPQIHNFANMLKMTLSPMIALPWDANMNKSTYAAYAMSQRWNQSLLPPFLQSSSKCPQTFQVSLPGWLTFLSMMLSKGNYPNIGLYCCRRCLTW